jgi:hypothetical protein
LRFEKRKQKKENHRSARKGQNGRKRKGKGKRDPRVDI